MVPRENKNNAFARFGGTDKEYYGIFQSGLFECWSAALVDERILDNITGKYELVTWLEFAFIIPNCRI